MLFRAPPPPELRRMCGLTRRGGPPAVAAAMLALFFVAPAAAAPFQDEPPDDYGEEDPDPLTVTAAADEASVPLGNVVGLIIEAAGGVGDAGDFWIATSAVYSPDACPSVETDGGTLAEEHDFLVSVDKAGPHEVTVTATDEAAPPATATANPTVTITGLPPDSIEMDASGGDGSVNPGPPMPVAIYQVVELIKYDVTAGGEPMGLNYDPHVQQIVEHRFKNLITGEWEDFYKVYGDRQTDVWHPPVGQNLTTFNWDAAASEIECLAATGWYDQAFADRISTLAEGIAISQQKQWIRIPYTEGCEIKYHEEEEPFFPTAYTIGPAPRSGEGSVGFEPGKPGDLP